jgi:hypothetical protein
VIAGVKRNATGHRAARLLQGHEEKPGRQVEAPGAKKIDAGVERREPRPPEADLRLLRRARTPCAPGERGADEAIKVQTTTPHRDFKRRPEELWSGICETQRQPHSCVRIAEGQPEGAQTFFLSRRKMLPADAETGT